MSIQGNINQMIGIGAALATQMPVAEAHKKNVAAKKEQKAAVTQVTRGLASIDTSNMQTTTYATEEIISNLQRGYTAALRRGDIKASKQLLEAIDMAQAMRSTAARAMAQTRVQAKKKQREDFNRLRGTKNGNN